MAQYRRGDHPGARSGGEVTNHVRRLRELRSRGLENDDLDGRGSPARPRHLQRNRTIHVEIEALLELGRVHHELFGDLRLTLERGHGVARDADGYHITTLPISPARVAVLGRRLAHQRGGYIVPRARAGARP